MRRASFSLLLEAVEQAAVGREHLRAQHLERHDLVELAVARAVHDAHAALAERLQDLVARGQAAEGGVRTQAGGIALDQRRRAAAAGRALFVHRGVVVAQEGDELFLLAQVGKQALKARASVPISSRLVTCTAPEKEPSRTRSTRSTRRRTGRVMPLAHRIRGAQAADERHQRRADEAVAEAAEGRHLLVDAAQRRDRAHHLAACRPQRRRHRQVRRIRQGDGDRLRARFGRAVERVARFADGRRRQLPGTRVVREEGDFRARQLADVAREPLVEGETGDENALQGAAGRHRHRHGVVEARALLPDGRRFLAVEHGEDERIVRQVGAFAARASGARQHAAARIGDHEQVGAEVGAALGQRVLDGRQVARLHHRLERRLVGQGAQAELELVVAVGLERLPDAGGLRQPLAQALARQPVRLERGVDERRQEQPQNQGADERQDLLREAHARTVNTFRPCCRRGRTCCGARPTCSARRRAPTSRRHPVRPPRRSARPGRRDRATR